jgi:predicted PurR-regulated permease PerM
MKTQKDRIPVLTYGFLALILALITMYAIQVIMPFITPIFFAAVLAAVTWKYFALACSWQQYLKVPLPGRVSWHSLTDQQSSAVYHALAWCAVGVVELFAYIKLPTLHRWEENEHRGRLPAKLAWVDQPDWLFRFNIALAALIAYGLMRLIVLVVRLPKLQQWQMRPLLTGRRIMAFVFSTLIMLMIVLPVLFIMSIVIAQSVVVLSDLTSVMNGDMQTEEFGLAVMLLDAKEWTLVHLPEFMAKELREYLAAVPIVDFGSGMGKMLLGFFQQTTKTVFGLVAASAVVWMALYAWFVWGPTFLREVQYYLPMDDEHEERFFLEFVQMSRAIVFGTLIVGGVQGLVDGLVLMYFDVPGAMLWMFVMMILAIIPGIGINLVMIPLAIMVMMTTSLSDGFIILGIALFVGTVDGPIRAQLMGSFSELNEWFILFSSLGGMLIYGPIGVLIGPIMWALFIEGLKIAKFEVEEIKKRRALEQQALMQKELEETARCLRKAAEKDRQQRRERMLGKFRRPRNRPLDRMMQVEFVIVYDKAGDGSVGRLPRSVRA